MQPELTNLQSRFCADTKNFCNLSLICDFSQFKKALEFSRISAFKQTKNHSKRSTNYPTTVRRNKFLENSLSFSQPISHSNFSFSDSWHSAEATQLDNWILREQWWIAVFGRLLSNDAKRLFGFGHLFFRANARLRVNLWFQLSNLLCGFFVWIFFWVKIG
jgi:hypothetical protein